MKVVTVQGKRWWVPEDNSCRLAVPIEDERDYYRAIADKLLMLVREVGPLPKAVALVTWIMEPQGLEVEPTNDAEQLIAQFLATSSVGEMVRSGAPWMSEPAELHHALDAIEAQGELTLSDFLA
jgi:hypothetical protein